MRRRQAGGAGGRSLGLACAWLQLGPDCTWYVWPLCSLLSPGVGAATCRAAAAAAAAVTPVAAAAGQWHCGHGTRHYSVAHEGAGYGGG
jgi:hypothetical protein